MAVEEAQGSTPLFGVFLLSLISIVLVPYTLHRLFSGEQDDSEVVRTWSSGKKDRKRPGLATRMLARIRSTFTPRMMVMWTVYMLLLWYVQSAAKPMNRFDPFEILDIGEDASEAEIKRAYRKLSLQYHPDKNPDPEAASYFAESITKAYKALTDDVSRENYRKYGHPDGPQAVSISVALPEWFFNKDKEAAPAILLVLLLGGIVLPLGVAAWYMGRSQNYSGPNEVYNETVIWYCHPKYGVKARQGATRLAETLVIAREFLELPLTPDQGPALVELRQVLSSAYMELREKDKAKDFYEKRNPKLVKVHMLLLAHMARIRVPPALRKDLAYVLEKVPRLLQELFSASMRSVFEGPRVRPHYGWLVPAVGTVELMQCLIQAVPPEERKKTAGNPAKSGEASAALLQLPHVDDDVIRQLVKKRIRSLPELQALEKSQRRNALQTAGLSGADADEVETALSALPSVFVAARMEVEDGEGGVVEEAWGLNDIVTVTAWAMLLRPSHQAPGFDPESVVRGRAARAYAPHYPHPREEHWFFMVADPTTGALLGWARVPLLDAEAAGARYAANWTTKATVGAAAGATSGGGGGGAVKDETNGFGGSYASDAAAAGGRVGGTISNTNTSNSSIVGGGDNASSLSDAELLERLGQCVEIQFLAPQAGKHNLMLYVMPDSWLGADRAVSLGQLRTIEPTRAQREGRVLRAATGRRGGGKATATGGGKGGTALQRSEESEGMAVEDGNYEEIEVAEDGDDDDDDHDENGDDQGAVGNDGEKASESEEDEGEPEWDSDEYGSEETASESGEASEEE